MNDFHIAEEEEIYEGKTTDVYFRNTMEIFDEKDIGDEDVVAEFTTSSLPSGWEWAVFVGLDEVLTLLEGKDVDVYALPEGTVFRARGEDEIYTPVMVIEGAYEEFCIYETPILGFICHPSGVATKSARTKKSAGEKEIMSFGIRRMHPGISKVIDRAAYIGGCDAISCIAGAETVGVEPKGTMPHSLSIISGESKKAFESFEEILPEDIPRIALVDTYNDETVESLSAAEAMGDDLYGVRLDTPSSRRGDLIRIVKEVRWELEERGYEDVKIIASGGMDEYSIPELSEAGVDAFGVGTSISNARTVNFAMDIVEKEGEPVAKRGKYSGRKEVYRCPDCFTFEMMSQKKMKGEGDGAEEPPTCDCGNEMESMLEKVMEDGEIIGEYPGPQEIKERVNEQLDKVDAEWLED